MTENQTNHNHNTTAALSDLKEVVDSLQNQMDRLSDKLDRLSEDVATLRKLLTGNGDPSSGLLIRQDRNDNYIQRQSKTIAVALGASITSLLAVIWKLILK